MVDFEGWIRKIVPWGRCKVNVCVNNPKMEGSKSQTVLNISYIWTKEFDINFEGLNNGRIYILSGDQMFKVGWMLLFAKNSIYMVLMPTLTIMLSFYKIGM